MSSAPIQRSLISTYDKTGIVEFARTLASEFGIEILSTGGTAQLLKDSGIPVTPVETVTGFAEMMEGRVKTLHPHIHAGILADRANPDHLRQLEEQRIKTIDMVVVNLYPFEKTIADPDCDDRRAIEMIDIGGPCMLRAAAKNHAHVVVMCDVATQGERVLAQMRKGVVGLSCRRQMAAVAFRSTCAYDAAITEWMGTCEIDKGQDSFENLDPLVLSLPRIASLRYGENSHQRAAVHVHASGCGEPSLLAGPGDESATTELSFNNYADAHAALELCKDLTGQLHRPDKGQPAPCCAFIKHTNACGVGVADTQESAYQRAYSGDPNAAMGGILVGNFPVDGPFASLVMGTYARWGKSAGAGGFFVEVWVAPSFSGDAVETIRSAKPWGGRARLISAGDFDRAANTTELDLRKITGGLLLQERDLLGLNEEDWQVPTKRQPTDRELADLRLAWLICKHTKSNAISLCQDQTLIGNGAGQMSRVVSCRIATMLARENGHEDSLNGAVAASDAFFPFPDGPRELMDAGITAIIQPGGSKRDEDTIAACDERNATMILTGSRHFKH